MSAGKQGSKQDQGNRVDGVRASKSGSEDYRKEKGRVAGKEQLRLIDQSPFQNSAPFLIRLVWLATHCHLLSR